MASVDSFTYDLSVIVPVYNSEAYLARCVASLDAQTAPQLSFEVVLVNDGSPDGSLAICRQLVAKRDNYVLVDQTNQGVSAARNAGMRSAHGRYLMFLDPDDELSAPSIEGIVKTFDACGDAIDLLTYPLCYHEVETGKEYRNQRERWLGESGAYDLEEHPFVAQSTINVVVRNGGVDQLLFDQSREIYEDQVFDTTLLERACAIGWCAEAEYKYYRSAYNTSSLRDRPELNFDDVMSALELFCDMAQRSPRFARYAHALVLYNAGWRFRAEKLFPDFGDKETRAANYQRLSAVLQRVPLSCWLESPYLGSLWPLDLVLRSDEGVEVRGHCLVPPQLGEQAITLQVNGIAWPLSLEPMYPSRDGEGMGSCCCRFSFILPPMSKRSYEAQLMVTDDEAREMQPDLVFKLVRTNGRLLNRNTRGFGDWRLLIDGGHLQVRTLKNVPVWALPFVRPFMGIRERRRTGNFDVERVRELRRSLPRALRACKREVAWLYDDGAAADVRPALERLLKDAATNDGVVRRYVVDEADERGHGSLQGAQCVVRESFEHLVCLLNAQKVVTPCSDVSALLPCEQPIYDRVRDFTRVGQCYVFLGDGYSLPVVSAFDECMQ